MAKQLNLLNLSGPIFVYYVNIGTISKAKAEESIRAISEQFQYDNSTFWVVPVKGDEPTRIELLYNPSGSVTSIYNGKLNS